MTPEHLDWNAHSADRCAWCGETSDAVYNGLPACAECAGEMQREDEWIAAWEENERRFADDEE